MVVLIDSQCGSPQTTDAKYLEVCSGKKCNCTSTAINSVSVSYMCHIMYCMWHGNLICEIDKIGENHQIYFHK